MVAATYEVLSAWCWANTAKLKKQSQVSAHSRIGHYFFSYLLSYIEVLEFMAQMWQYIVFLSLKPIKVSSDFILSYLKKKLQGTPPLRNLKNKHKNHDIFTMDAPHGVSGCQKNRKGKGSIPWCVFLLIFSPNWTNFEKPSQNSHFFNRFSWFYEVFWSLFNLGWILAQKHIKVLILVPFRFFWHPWHTPGVASI